MIENMRFPLARYQFQFKITEEINLPDYAGSTLRGAFGWALRKISCMTKQNECKPCPLYRTCPYTTIFETPAPQNHQLQKFSQVPNGYIIEPPKWGRKMYQKGEMLTFNLVLFGRLVHQLPLISFSFKRAFEYNIAGGKGELVAIKQLLGEDQSMDLLEDNILIEHQAEINIQSLSPKIILEIVTPLRLQENGRPLKPNEITLNRFLISLAKRISLLSEFHHQPLDLDFNGLISQINQITDQKSLHWLDWERYSSRQQQRMKLGGVVGTWQLNNVPEQWAKLLYLGQWLHNGKNATFGLGQYKITNL